MGIREDFDDLLSQWGYPILIVRQSKKMRCSCWNEKRQEADRDCPVCFGLGFAPIVEKHTGRGEDISSPDTFPLIQKGSNYGGMSVPGRQYFFRYNCNISQGDLIVEVEWTEQGKPKYDGGGIYEVSHISPQRFKHGEIGFKKIYCKDEPVEKEIRGIRIVNVNGITNYEIAMKG